MISDLSQQMAGCLLVVGRLIVDLVLPHIVDTAPSDNRGSLQVYG